MSSCCLCVWAEATGLLPRLAALPAHAAAGSINVCVCVLEGQHMHVWIKRVCVMLDLLCYAEHTGAHCSPLSLSH